MYGGGKMRIDGISGVPQPENGKDPKGERPKKAERSNEDLFVGTKLDFKTFISMAASVSDIEKSRSQKVDQIKALVQSGQYSVNVENIVKKMMNEIGEF